MWSWLRTSQKPSVEERQVPALHFVGEQDGKAERDLKAKWIALLSQTPDVKRAFLARAIPAGETTPTVLLCICPQLRDPDELVKRLAVPFRDEFGADQHLDIAFLSAAQEADVSLVAMPFFSAT